jgi:hypothetical protein
MRGFILGILFTLIIGLGGAYFYATTGHFDARAVGNTPSTFERRTANRSTRGWMRMLPSNPIRFSRRWTMSWMVP